MVVIYFSNQLIMSKDINILKEELKNKVEITQGSFLAFTAKQDSMYPEIKPSIIKFLNPAVLCPNVNTVVLLHEWHRQYAYRHESVEKKQRIDSNVIECCIENKI